MALARLVVSIVWLSMYGYIVKHKALCSPCMLLDASGQNDIAAFLSECLPAAFVAYAVRSYAVHSGSASSEWANNSLLLRSHVLTRCTARGNGSIRVSDRSVHRRSQNSSKLASLPVGPLATATLRAGCRLLGSLVARALESDFATALLRTVLTGGRTATPKCCAEPGCWAGLTK